MKELLSCMGFIVLAYLLSYVIVGDDSRAVEFMAIEALTLGVLNAWDE